MRAKFGWVGGLEGGGGVIRPAPGIADTGAEARRGGDAQRPAAGAKGAGQPERSDTVRQDGGLHSGVARSPTLSPPPLCPDTRFLLKPLSRVERPMSLSDLPIRYECCSVCGRGLHRVYRWAGWTGFDTRWGCPPRAHRASGGAESPLGRQRETCPSGPVSRSKSRFVGQNCAEVGQSQGPHTRT